MPDAKYACACRKAPLAYDLALKWKEEIMKSIRFFSVAAMLLSVAGCATPPVVVLAPVGPNPVGRESVASMGALQVFSSEDAQSDDQNQAGDGEPFWYQHSEYNIYDLHGKRVKHVYNVTGHYSETPERIALPAGRYLVQAQAKDYSPIEIPVTIERGRTTRVHLDDNWKPPADAPKRELVTMPNGNPVGWRVESAKEIGIN
jgi:hypothetical protein